MDLRLVDALLQPSAYPHPVAAVTLVETHISYLFLTGKYVYKVKKPVRYAFLDFSTLEQRRYFCARELKLNRRFSPSTYLAVCPIRAEADSIHVEGAGKTVEYAVKMRQMPAARALSTLLREGHVDCHDMERLAQRIAALHAEAPHGPEVAKWGGSAQLHAKILGNLKEASALAANIVAQDDADELAAFAEAFLAVHCDVFDRRAAVGRVRDCHGDLHAAQIYLENGITFLDCIEFNDAFRCIDVAEDIAFLAMDLEQRGHPELSRCFTESYAQTTGDREGLLLLPLLQQYRACVRGKVIGLLAAAAGPGSEHAHSAAEEAAAYFALARAYLPQPAGPELFLVAGLMGSGKTTVAKALAQRWNLTYLSSDITRKSLAGIPLLQRAAQGYEEGIYAPAFSRATYERLCSDAESTLHQGASVVLDASFHQAGQRQAVLRMAKELKVPCRILECRAPEAEIRRRLELRELTGSVSDGRWALFHRQRAAWQPITEISPRQHIVVDTLPPLRESLRKLLRELYQIRLVESG